MGMGSDDFCVKVRKVEACDSVSGAPRVNCGSAGGCSSASDVIKAVDAIGATSQRNTQTRFLKCENQISNYDPCEILKNSADGNGNSAYRLISEDFQSSWKARKVPKTNFTSSKRAHASQIDGFSGASAIGDFKNLFDKSLKRTISPAKNNDLVRQRNVVGDKRVERKASKLLTKNTQEFLSMTSSSTNLTISSGANNVLGLLGSKSNVPDITQLVDDLSLDEMLESAFFGCPTSSNKKMMEAVNSNDSIMCSLRKACSVLQPSNPSKPQNLELSDGVSENKMPPEILGPISIDEGGVDGDNSGDPATNELSSGSKNHDNGGTPDRQTLPLDLHVYQHNELWDKLELVVPMDLNLLLLDVSKLSTSSRSLSDLYSGKQVAQPGCLTPFAWSHAFNGIPRSNSDAAKFPTSRNPCQARWVRIAHTYNLSANSGGCYSDLDSIRYNKDLVPSVKGACAMPLSKIISPESPVAPKQEGTMSSLAVCPPASHEHCTDTDRHSPRLIAAAQTLYITAASSSRGNPDYLPKWSRESTRKSSIKPEKPKWNYIPEEDSVTPTSASKDHAQKHEQILSKKPRISNVQLASRKTSTGWSAPRSSVRESITRISKQPRPAIPASQVLNKAKANEGHKWPKRPFPLSWASGRDGFR